MRAHRRERPAFLAGVAVGLSLGGVVLLTAVAARRIRSRREADHPRYLDLGPEPIELEVRPSEEGNACEEPPRLESELPEFSPLSQRW